jgi:hypothetical protein
LIARLQAGADQKKAKPFEFRGVSELPQGVPHSGVGNWSDVLCIDAEQMPLHPVLDWREFGRGSVHLTEDSAMIAVLWQAGQQERCVWFVH